MMTEVGLRNTFWALVLPQVFGSPYAIFLLREYLRGIPSDLLDAAKLDGCGTLRTLRHVMVPVSRPILATLTIITVVAQWNNFLVMAATTVLPLLVIFLLFQRHVIRSITITGFR